METVVLMAKAPIPGAAKTRLCPPLSPGEAARLYESLLLGTAGRLRAVPGIRRTVAYSPPGAAAYFRGAAFDGFTAVPQSGSDLGERMARAIRAAFSEGARRVAVVGADCPGLSPGLVAQAFSELGSGAEAVLGPALDGGFYLAAFSRFPEGLFGKGIAWGTGTVLGTVARRLREAGVPWSLLREERDVDRPEDLSWWLTSRGPAPGRRGGGRGTSRSAGRRSGR